MGGFQNKWLLWDTVWLRDMWALNTGVWQYYPLMRRFTVAAALNFFCSNMILMDLLTSQVVAGYFQGP